MNISICVRCDKEFSFKPWESIGKYCSAQCRKTPVKRTNCPTCKKEFTYKPLPSRPIRIYCGNKCAVSYDHLSEDQRFEIMKTNFYQNIEPQSNGCLLWTGSKFPNGYGRLRFLKKDYLVHRFAYNLYFPNSLTDDFIIQHSCDVRNCVEKSHLSLGTYKTNSDDCHNKKRHMYGDKHVHSRLSISKVKEIKNKLLNNFTHAEIAKEYNISRTTITLISNNKVWKHVTLED